MVRSQPRQRICKTLSRKNPSQKSKWEGGAGGEAQGVGPEFKPQHQKKGGGGRRKGGKEKEKGIKWK
jgi:hypothetical protein